MVGRIHNHVAEEEIKHANDVNTLNMKCYSANN